MLIDYAVNLPLAFPSDSMFSDCDLAKIRWPLKRWLLQKTTTTVKIRSLRSNDLPIVAKLACVSTTIRSVQFISVFSSQKFNSCKISNSNSELNE